MELFPIGLLVVGKMAGNGFWLAEGVELEAPKLNLLLMFKRITNAQK